VSCWKCHWHNCNLRNSNMSEHILSTYNYTINVMIKFQQFIIYTRSQMAVTNSCIIKLENGDTYSIT
jgi:hypothetical protein